MMPLLQGQIITLQYQNSNALKLCVQELSFFIWVPILTVTLDNSVHGAYRKQYMISTTSLKWAD